MNSQNSFLNTGDFARDGQSQNQRFAAALDPGSIDIDDRSLKAFLDFADAFAGQLHFINAATDGIDGNWGAFFEPPADDFIRLLELHIPEEKVLAAIDDSGTQPPHYALYLAFLRLYRHARHQINGLTKKHLDFYYRRVLKFVRQAATPDKAHLIFKLKKDVSEELIPAGTPFKAGKDNTGVALQYMLTNDIVVYPAVIDSLRSVFVNAADNDTIHMAPIADSADGLGGELDKLEPKWAPFGSPDLPRAEVGFALSAPVLRMKEGTRKVIVDLYLAGIPAGLDLAVFGKDAFNVYLSGESGWIGPRAVSLEPVDIAGGFYRMDLTINKDDPGIIDYDNRLHGADYDTEAPILQVLLNPDKTDPGYAGLKSIELKKARLKVEVTGIESLLLENDLGQLDAAKPFMPFGPQPTSGANLYVGYPEAFGKQLEQFKLHVKWQDAPTQLSSIYDRTGYRVSANSDFRARLTAPVEGLQKNTYDVTLFNNTNAAASHTITIPPEGQPAVIAAKAKDFRRRAYSLRLQKSQWARKQVRKIQLTSKVHLLQPGLLKMMPLLTTTATRLKTGYISLQLKSGFLHKEYRQLYTKTIVECATQDDCELSLPQEPYTPVMAQLTLDYTAVSDTVGISSSQEDDFLNDELVFYHIGVFGQMRDHGFQRQRLPFVADKNTPLLPVYTNEGEFYVGYSGIEPRRTLSVLFQVVEGSADPTLEKQTVNWSILCDNYWKPLTDADILADTTNGLLTSGIIQFYIPAEATDTNTLMPTGHFWLKAAVVKNTAAIGQLIDVKPNAALAQFKNQDNDPEHLRTPLEAGRISKFVSRIAGIKSVVQPYATFGGKMAEDDRSLYTRASERLRHKYRAVTIWDYERMVLQHFPAVYKVKCLSHTAPTCYTAAGHVTLVAVPQLRNRHAVDPLQPKVDLDTLDKIQKYLRPHTGYFVQIHVVNPLYEEIKVAFGVQFKRGYEFGYYQGVLNQDIKQFLSPWAFEDGVDIVFGGRVHKSVILNFVEKRDYVDYVTDFKLYHSAGEGDLELASASDARAILVSAATHEIKSA